MPASNSQVSAKVSLNIADWHIWWRMPGVTPAVVIGALLDNGASALIVPITGTSNISAHYGRLFPPFPRVYFPRRFAVIRAL